MNANEKNFEIPYAEITKVEMKKPPKSLLGALFGSPTIDIFIFTHTEKQVFFIKEEEFNVHEKLLRSVLPDKLFIS